MDTFINNFELKSWQVFSEGEGACIKIRFKPVDHIGNSTVKPQPSGKWKKASPSQVKRDSVRSQKHSMEMRSRDSSDKENPRSLDLDMQSALNVSSVTVKSASSLMSDCSEKLDYSPDSDTRSVVNITATEPCSSEQSPREECILSPLPSVVEQSDSDSEWSDTDIPSEIKCPAKSCCYGDSNGDPSVPVYLCTRCEHLYVCISCFNDGGHRNHRKYLVPYSESLKESISSYG